MKCKNCGAEIPNDVTVCPYCDKLIQEKKLDGSSVSIQNMQQDTSVPEEKQMVTRDVVIGKKYSFASSRGANLHLSGLLMSRVLNEVEIHEDRITIETVPKRLNNAPVVFLEDITSIDITTKINAYYWFWIILTALAAFATGFSIILTVILIFVGMDKKIRISQRNGKDVIIYSSNSKMAESFRYDMRMVTNIR